MPRDLSKFKQDEQLGFSRVSYLLRVWRLPTQECSYFPANVG